MTKKPLHLLAFVLLAAILTFTLFLIMAVTMGPGFESDSRDNPNDSPYAEESGAPADG